MRNSLESIPGFLSCIQEPVGIVSHFSSVFLPIVQTHSHYITKVFESASNIKQNRHFQLLLSARLYTSTSVINNSTAIHLRRRRQGLVHFTYISRGTATQRRSSPGHRPGHGERVSRTMNISSVNPIRRNCTSPSRRSHRL